METLFGDEEADDRARSHRQQAGTPVSGTAALFRASAKDRVRMATIDKYVCW
jgi:hypothetical protein